MKITLLTVGRLKEAYWEQAVEEYRKRLQAYARLEIVEVADEKTPDRPSPALKEQILKKEGERLLARCPRDAYVIVLAISGKPMSSEAFAEKIGSLGVRGVSHLVFVIGGSLGLWREVEARGDLMLSFSAMTFPHQMMRVILLEQIYRGFRILNHEPYHK